MKHFIFVLLSVSFLNACAPGSEANNSGSPQSTSTSNPATPAPLDPLEEIQIVFADLNSTLVNSFDYPVAQFGTLCVGMKALVRTNDVPYTLREDYQFYLLSNGTISVSGYRDAGCTSLISFPIAIPAGSSELTLYFKVDFYDPSSTLAIGELWIPLKNQEDKYWSHIPINF